MTFSGHHPTRRESNLPGRGGSLSLRPAAFLTINRSSNLPRRATETCAIRLRTVDTLFPFGSASLERLSRTFLGTGKLPAFSTAEKSRMLQMFRERTGDAYGYAYRDVALTLLVYEQMKSQDCRIYTSLGIPKKLIAPMRPTVGGRVSNFLVAATRHFMTDSKILSGERQLKALMSTGGLQRFANGADGSHFGEQTGAVHGGLLINRTPTRLWHEVAGAVAGRRHARLLQ